MTSTAPSAAPEASLPVPAPSAAPEASLPVPAPSSAVPPTDAAAVPEVKKKKPRRVVDVVSVDADFAFLVKLVDDHIEALRKTAADHKKTGATGIKFLRTVNSKLKQLRKDAKKTMEAKKKRPRKAGKTEGGFLKPHNVTSECAAFAEWPLDAMKSRIDITKSICKYVEDHNLQDPVVKKIIQPDAKLKELLQYDPVGKDPLTYVYLQKLIGRLQVKPPKPEVVKAPEASPSLAAVSLAAATV